MYNLPKNQQSNSVELIRVTHVSDSISMPAAQKPRYYHIFLRSSAAEQSQSVLYVLPPDAKMFTLEPEQTDGYHAWIREELVLMLQCHHLMPFSPLASRTKTPIPNEIAQDLLGKTLDKIILACNGESTMVSTKLYGLVKILLVYVSRQCLPPADIPGMSAKSVVFHRFMDLLRTENSAEKGLTDYASTLCISPYRLNEIIRRGLGCTASRLIQQKKIYLAKQAAIMTHDSMKNVAINLGFNDLAHFSKFFRNATGMTFSDFKKTFQIL